MSARKMDQAVVTNHGTFIWRIANLLRGTYEPAHYGSVILPFVVLRRLDCLLEPTKAETLARLVAIPHVPDSWSTTRRHGSATRFRSPDTSTSTRRLGRSKRSTPRPRSGSSGSPLFDGETKRVDYFHSRISLLYLEAAGVGDAG